MDSVRICVFNTCLHTTQYWIKVVTRLMIMAFTFVHKSYQTDTCTASPRQRLTQTTPTLWAGEWAVGGFQKASQQSKATHLYYAMPPLLPGHSNTAQARQRTILQSLALALVLVGSPRPTPPPP